MHTDSILPESPAAMRIVPVDYLHPLPLADLFGREAPLMIDLGSGKGRFLLARAAQLPDWNVLGIERMLRRVRKVCNRAHREGLANVRILRMEAYYAVTYLVPAGAVRRYYLFFPDPWPKKKHHDHRLFNPRFMDALHRTLTPDGVIHVATDHLPYYQDIRALFAADPRFTETDPDIPAPDERTEFEAYYCEKKEIGRCSFRKSSPG